MIDDRRFFAWNILLPVSLVSALGFFAYEFGYLVFHVFAETVSIVIGGTTLLVAHTSQRFARNQYLLLIAAVLGWCMLIDMVHLVTYPGMGLVILDEQNVSLSLWASARGLQALGMLVAIQLMSRRVPLVTFHAVVGVTALLLIAAALQGWMPPMYEEGLRLSRTKLIVDWSIVALHLLTLSILWRIRHDLPEGVRRYIPVSLLSMAGAEILFSLEANLFGPANVAGHLLKFLSYWFIYLALIYSTLREPFSALVSAARIYEAVPDPTLIVDEMGRIRQANAAAGRVLGVPAAQLVGKTTHSLFHNTDVDPADCDVCRALRDGHELDRHELLRRHGASLLQVSIRKLGTSGDQRGEYVEVLNDLTEMQRAREQQRALESRLERQTHADSVLYGLLGILAKAEPQCEELEQIVKTLPMAFRAPNLLRVHLQSPWLVTGRRAGSGNQTKIERPLDFGQRGTGLLEVYYQDSVGTHGEIFDPTERALVEAVAKALSASRT